MYAVLSNPEVVLRKIDDGEVASELCKYCSEVHIGPSGHKAQMGRVFRFESWRGRHIWQNASVDDLVPPKIVWHWRPQDPPELVDEGKQYYGHAPAVVDLCVQVGAVPLVEYPCVMKTQRLSAPFKSENEDSGRLY
ncbi:hypothetical protein MLD38_015777 [Melastoma candidum]|uniref:Uncharacterized protein n=1 Tax=Melastoma candidum TaxID=119954 RepID=A0ACB9RQQ6_9MYRT|nr:hypothetical protein MLD38_015777 [Melastoma candidum]